MPLLDRSGWRDDPFRRFEDATIEDAHAALVPWASLGEALARRREGQQLGAEVPNDLDPAEVAPAQAELALVSILFPSHADGRGFSLARRLRRQGFSGRLRARGPLIADQLADALACGFDEIELDRETAARQPVEQWMRAAGAFSWRYQRGFGPTASILDLRRAVRDQEGPSDVR